MSYIAKNRQEAVSQYYTCKEDYQPQIKDYVKGRNIYRQNEELIQQHIEREKFNVIVNTIEPKYQKLLLPTQLDEKVRQLNREQRIAAQEELREKLIKYNYTKNQVPNGVQIGSKSVQEFMKIKENIVKRENLYYPKSNVFDPKVQARSKSVLTFNMKNVNQIK